MSIKRIDSSQSGDGAIGNWRIQTMTAMSCAWAAFVRALESVKKLQIGVCHIAHQSSHHFAFCLYDTRYREPLKFSHHHVSRAKFFSFLLSSFLTRVSSLRRNFCGFFSRQQSQSTAHTFSLLRHELALVTFVRSRHEGIRRNTRWYSLESFFLSCLHSSSSTRLPGIRMFI